MKVMREKYVRMMPGEINLLWFSFNGGTAGGNGQGEDGEEKSDLATNDRLYEGDDYKEDHIQICALPSKAVCDPSPNTYLDDGMEVKCPTMVVELQLLAGRPPNNNLKENSSPPLFPKAKDATSHLARSSLSCVL